MATKAEGKRFFEEKERVLKEKADLSKKGSIDAPIVGLVECLNESEPYYTTSSCSGRILLYADQSSGVRKKGCHWLLISHEPVSMTQLKAVLHEQPLSSEYTFFKFEPFVLHVVCSSLSSAQNLLQKAVGAGFRNSGITMGKKKRLLLAVRSTHSLETPVAHNRQLLVSEEYLTHLVTLANQKLALNLERVARFHTSVQQLLSQPRGVSTDRVSPTHPPKRMREPQSKRSEDEYGFEEGDIVYLIGSGGDSDGDQ